MPGCRIITAAFLMAAALVACATSASRSPAERDAIIAQLAAARRTDQQNALAPDTGPVAQGDLMYSASRAENLIGRLGRGDYVSQKEIDQALVIPPKNLTSEQRQDFIRQLEAARQLDVQGTMDYTREPDKTEDYIVKIKMIDQTIRQLRGDGPVSWWAIQQALHVPQNP